jgi:solute:Na+ symporter, SSS family
MGNQLVTTDYLVFLFYFILVAGYGYWIYTKKQKASMDTKDYFLAEGSLTWWAIGASMIASNISAEQFIGMSGNGFIVGVAVAAYEWVAAIALILLATFFMPIYLKNHIYTMPQFLKMRYNETASLVMAIFWLFLYVLVNLTSILYLGALAIDNLVGGGYFHMILIALAVFALVITLGGMKVIGYTDVIQVMVLIIGGLATVVMALQMVSTHFGFGADMWKGLSLLMEKANDHFHLILPKPDAAMIADAQSGSTTAAVSQASINKYIMLPGIAMYFVGQWIVNLNYWACNQYITQRALGADLKTARTGILFAAMLKIFMPVIVMLPGIAAYVLYQNGALQAQMAPNGHLSPDNAYSSILSFLPTGLKGLALAALTAAIVASLAGKANSISTIFTLDLYKNYINKEADEKKLVRIGRTVILVSMIIAIALTWKDALGIGGEGGFTFIQKYTGYISPGVFAMFTLGLFWKRTTPQAGVAGLLVGFGLSVFGNNTWLYTAYPNGKGGFEIPFLLCMGFAYVFAMLTMFAMSMMGPVVNPKALPGDEGMYKLDNRSALMIAIILLVLSALYVKLW